MGRGFLWLVVVGNAVLGGALAVVALALLARPGTWSTATSLLVALTGVFWVAAGSVGFHRMYLHRPALDGARVRLEPVRGRPAVVLPWSSTVIAVPTATLTGLTALLAAATVLQLAAGGGAGAWFTGGLAVVLLPLLPDAWLRLRRRPWLALTVEGVTVHGWDGDAELVWDRVRAVDLADAGSWTTLRVVARAGSAPEWHRRRRVLLAPAPRGPYLEVPLPALDVDPHFLAGTIMFYAENPATRREIADGTARTRLVERLRPVA
ncbi:hypothetical protein CHMI_00101 [Cellulomonas hominis]|nr:hypothetical protein CHMI_00101 [Cellulomonas hominis]